MDDPRIVKWLMPVVLLGAAVMSFLIVTHVSNSSVTHATLEIQAAPSGAQIKLDGKGIRAGKRQIDPGTHTLIVSRKGFTSQTKKIDFEPNDTQFVGIALKPNTDQTSDWYNKHKDDQLEAESIASRSADQSAQTAAGQLPLLNVLPAYGIHDEFQIDYGTAPPLLHTTQPAVLVQAKDVQSRNDAIAWIKNQGFDPSDYIIIFINSPKTFGGIQ